MNDMSEKSTEQIQKWGLKPRSNSTRTAMLVGLLAGVGYAMGSWLIESVMLYSAHGMFPFLRLVIGAAACGLVGLLAGWLSRRFSHVLANVIIWVLAGAVMNRLVLWINFPFMQKLLVWLEPQFSGLIQYPLDYGVNTRGTLMLVITMVASALIGLFANNTVEAGSTQEGVRRALSLLIWSGLFFAIGLLAASMNTHPIRDAVVSLDQSIQFAIEHSGEDLSVQTQSRMGLFGLKSIQPFINQPYRLIPASYDTQLVFIQVLVDFADQKALCPVIRSNLGTCNLIN